MSRDRAAYMREYRARKAAANPRPISSARLEDVRRIVELEDEVAQLKRDLAARPPAGLDVRAFNSRPFTPVPKKS